MGIFSSLLNGRQTSEESVPAPEKAAADFPELRRGMTIHVTFPDGEQLLTGKLTAVAPSELTIQRLPGALSFQTCTPGKTVSIRGCTPQLVPFLIQGTVETSTRTLFKMKGVKTVPINEHRDNFRLKLNAPAALYYLSDKRFENPEDCVLLDLSTGGACIKSEFLHAEGEALHLRFKIDDYIPMDFLGEIIRVQETSSGAFRYGFLFAQLTEEEITSLTKTIYNIQVGNRSVWVREGETP